MTTEQTKRVVEQEVLQWIGEAVQNPLQVRGLTGRVRNPRRTNPTSRRVVRSLSQTIGAAPEDAVQHHLDQVKKLLEDDLDPKVVEQTKQIMEQLGLPVEKM